MPVAIRAITRLQDADDINVSLGAGVDEYTLTWDNDTAKFVLRAPVTGYLLATGAVVGATSQAQNFTVGVTVGSVTTPATLLQVAETSTASPRGIMSSQHNTGTDGARFHMRKSRGTNATPVAVVSGDMLGRLVASGYDGSNYLEMGGIDIVSAGTIASTRVPTEIRFSTATDAAPSVLTQRMVIDKAGQVGIGTLTPTYKLDIQGSFRQANTGNVVLMVQTYSGDGNSVAINIAGAGTNANWFILSNRADLNGAVDSLGFYKNAGTTGTKLVISDGGFVGIGITAPATMLHVVSTTAATNAVRDVLALGTDVTGAGVGDVGLGAAIKFNAESSTTTGTAQAAIEASWIIATHASRTARLAFKAYDSAGAREGLRIDSDGAQVLIGFYAHASVAQQVLATGAGRTADDIITALQALGLVKQS